MPLRALSIIVGLIVIGYGAFALSVPHTKDIPHPSTTSTATSSTAVVQVQDTYRKGTHKITGSVLVPDACALLLATTATTTNPTASTTVITLSLSAPASPGVCLRLPTQATFTSSIDAPQDATLRVLFNGLLVSTTPA